MNRGAKFTRDAALDPRRAVAADARGRTSAARWRRVAAAPVNPWVRTGSAVGGAVSFAEDPGIVTRPRAAVPSPV